MKKYFVIGCNLNKKEFHNHNHKCTWCTNADIMKLSDYEAWVYELEKFNLI